MTEQTFTDIAALRARSLEAFARDAKHYLDARPDMHSLVLAVSQYFADEAGDAVHEHVSAYATRDPNWPHQCTHEDARPGASRCRSCDDGLSYGELDSNTEAVHAWSACCSEWGGGEGESALVDPIAIARRGAEGRVELELVYEVVRPWLDNDRVAQERDEESWEEPADPPKPEPTRAPWTAQERPLLDAVYAQPLEAGPRRVLVDHWLERGDVRGEFGALSFDAPPTAEARARRDELARLHGREWVGPLQPVIPLWGASFARGPFPSRVVAWFDDVEGAEQLATLEDWAVVEALRVATELQLFSPAMRGLTELTGVTERGLFALQRSGLVAPIRTLGLVERPVPAAFSPTLDGVETLLIERAGSDLAGYVALPCWPKLKRVEVWFSLEDPVQSPAWADDRATEALRVLGPKLPPGATLTVGYLLGNGARGGVVALRAAGSAEVTLESRLFSGDDARRRAEERLRSAPRPRTEVAPVEPPPSGAGAGTTSPNALRRFLSRFGF
jgi:hypothetical protein